MDGQRILKDLYSWPPRRVGSFNPGANPRFTVIATIANQLAQQTRQLSAKQIIHLFLSPKIRPAMLKMTDRFAPHMTFERPVEPTTKAKRRAANLEAMDALQLATIGRSAATKLYKFTGWGGLSLEEVQGLIPPQFTQDSLALLHEWYTPSHVADAIAERISPFLDKLANNVGIVKALEPSAGVGRFLDSFNRLRPDLSIRWTAVELNHVSATILRKLHPYTTVHVGPYEAYNREYGDGKFDLVVANPPFGSQARTRIYASLDPDDRFREPFDYAYFIKRSIAALKRCGIAVFVVPRSFMSGTTNYNIALRSYAFRRVHLLSAFRLPSTGPGTKRLFPGQDLVVDVVVAQSRGGVLVADSPRDDDVVKGLYFEKNPNKILGKETTNSRGRYTVVTEVDLEKLPEIVSRPECVNCAIEPEKPPRTRRTTTQDELDPALAFAVSLGERVRAYLGAVARGKTDGVSWEELQTGLSDLHELYPNPWKWPALVQLANSGDVGAQGLLRGFEKNGELAEALREEPELNTRGLDSNDLIALAQKIAPAGGVLPSKLHELHRSLGGTKSETALTQKLLKQGYMIHEGRLYPEWEYLSGDLWHKYDSVPEGQQGELQRAALLAKMKPAVFADIEVDPRFTWVPLEVVRMWLVNGLNHEGIVLSRTDGVLRGSTGRKYGSQQVIEWLNHMSFSPHSEPPLDQSKYPAAIVQEIDSLAAEGKNITSAIRRRLWGIYYLDQFRQWIATEPGAQELLTNAYNRSFKGFVLPEFDDTPIHIERWTKDPNIQLRPHQIRAVKSRVMTRGGILALAVGAGKTFTSLAIIALGRQQGWIKRPVVVVPAGIVWQWYDEVARVLPDYRVGVVGSKRYIGKSGKKKGKLTSKTATPQERSDEWLKFQAGLYDLVLLTDTSLGTTKVSANELAVYAQQRDAMMRSLYLERKKIKGKRDDKITERDRAIMKHGAQAWVEEVLELKNRVYDPGVAWSDLGIDFLVYDETGNIRRTWSPAPREFGMPKYMGGSHKGSQRGWQADFRAALVRMNGGGILALSGTVGENSPAEPYNLLHFIDPEIMERVGITDVEQFLSRYVVIDSKRTMKPTGERKVEDAVVGFKNLNELRTILFTWGNFVSHEQAGIKLPDSEELLVEVEMSPAQREIYDFHRERAKQALKQRKSNSVFSALSRMREVTVHELLGGEGYSWSTAYGGLARKEVTEKALEFYEHRGWMLTESVLRKKIADDENAEIRSDLEAKLRRLLKSQEKSGMYKVEKLLPKPHTFSSAKIEACAERIAENLTCAHIVFVESTAAHAWLTEVLVKHGVKRERIGVINGYVGDVSEITRKFNGSDEEERSLDVVITNSKGTRGVNLQRQTCMLHNLDLRWTPADMEQRRGRIDRYGNTMPQIYIVFYFAKDSFDGFMFDILAGKGSWRDSLFLREGDRSINPAAQLDLGEAELFMLTARNKAEALEFKKQIEAEAEQKRLLEAGQRALRLFAQAAGRVLHASTVSESEAERLRKEARDYLDSLDKIDARAWPWKQASDDLWNGDPTREWVVGDYTNIPPFYPGMMLEHNGYDMQVGELLPGGFVGLRQNGTANWTSENIDQLRGARYSEATANDNRVTAAAVENVDTWHRAHEAWVLHQWVTNLDRIAATLRRTTTWVPLFTVSDGLTLTAMVPDYLKRQILPPTKTAWEVFRTWAPVCSAAETRLNLVARLWFGRELTLPTKTKSVVDREANKFTFAELECSNRILAMKPERFVGLLKREFERIRDTATDADELKVNLGPGINIEIEARRFTSADDLRKHVLRTLYRTYMTIWYRLAQAQLRLLHSEVVPGLDDLYYDVDAHYQQLAQALGHANARVFRVCAQLGSLDPAIRVDVRRDMFSANLRALVDGVSKARITAETETFVPVAHDRQFVTVKQVDLSTATVAKETHKAPGNLFALQTVDTLHERLPLPKGTMWIYTVTDQEHPAASHAWVNIHPADVKAVLGMSLEQLQDIDDQQNTSVIQTDDEELSASERLLKMIERKKERARQRDAASASTSWYPSVKIDYKMRGLKGQVHQILPDPQALIRFDETGTRAFYGRGVIGSHNDNLYFLDYPALVQVGRVGASPRDAIKAVIRQAAATEGRQSDTTVDLATSRYLVMAGGEIHPFRVKNGLAKFQLESLRREHDTGVITYKHKEFVLEARVTPSLTAHNLTVTWVLYRDDILSYIRYESRPFAGIAEEIGRLASWSVNKYRPESFASDVDGLLQIRGRNGNDR